MKKLVNEKHKEAVDKLTVQIVWIGQTLNEFELNLEAKALLLFSLSMNCKQKSINQFNLFASLENDDDAT